jgi:hypothetical protein
VRVRVLGASAGWRLLMLGILFEEFSQNFIKAAAFGTSAVNTMKTYVSGYLGVLGACSGPLPCQQNHMRLEKRECMPSIHRQMSTR